MTKQKEDWGKEFDEKFTNMKVKDVTIWPNEKLIQLSKDIFDPIKDFIHSLLKQERQKVLEKIKKIMAGGMGGKLRQGSYIILEEDWRKLKRKI